MGNPRRGREIRRVFSGRSGRDALPVCGLHLRRSTMCTIEVNALMSAVPASHITKIAPDALFLVNSRDNLVIQIEMLPLSDLRQAEPAKVFDSSEALFIHPMGEAVNHVLNDAESVMHSGSADLHGAAAEQQEFR